jgi:hypothetical protein
MFIASNFMAADSTLRAQGQRGPDPLQVTFAPDNPTPGPMTVSMAPGTITGDLFEIQILVTDIPEFYAAAFDVTYDAA